MPAKPLTAASQWRAISSQPGRVFGSEEKTIGSPNHRDGGDRQGRQGHEEAVPVVEHGKGDRQNTDDDGQANELLAEKAGSAGVFLVAKQAQSGNGQHGPEGPGKHWQTHERNTNQPWHPQVEFIARVLINRDGRPWIMRRRTQAEMDELVQEAGFEKLDMEIDNDGIFTVSVAKKRA